MSSSNAELMALERPGAAALVQEPKAGDVAEQPEGLADAALVRHVGGERPVVDEWVLELDADARPCAGAHVGGARTPERDGGDGGAGVVRRGRDHLRTGEARVDGDFVAEHTELGSRPDDLGEEAPRDLEALEEVEGPGALACVPTLGRGGVRPLDGEPAPEPVVHEVGYQQKRLCDLEHGVGFGGECGQLEDRVDRQVLDAGALVELTGGHDGQCGLDRLGPARIAVVDGVLEKPAPAVEQAEVDSPGVDADGVDGAGLDARGM